MKNDLYILKVSGTQGGSGAYRTLEVKGATSLYKLADAILSAFDFDNDHAYGFHENWDYMDTDSVAYTLFYDHEGGPAAPNEQSVMHNYVYKVFKPNKGMFFHFDYGFDWMFHVECLSLAEPVTGKKYPVVTEVVGEHPVQYPDESDEELDETPAGLLKISNMVW